MCSAYDAKISHTQAGPVPIKRLICLRDVSDFRIRMIALSLHSKKRSTRPPEKVGKANKKPRLGRALNLS